MVTYNTVPPSYGPYTEGQVMRPRVMWASTITSDCRFTLGVVGSREVVIFALTPRLAAGWPKHGARWSPYQIDKYLEPAEGPW